MPTAVPVPVPSKMYEAPLRLTSALTLFDRATRTRADITT